MKAPLLRLVLIIGFAILLLMAGVASAGPRGQGWLQARRAQAAQGQQAHDAQQAREAPGEAKPAAPPAGAQQLPPQQRPGRLTPDERRALRRQIDDAAREVYRAPR
jgi:hypothetical protein